MRTVRFLTSTLDCWCYKMRGTNQRHLLTKLRKRYPSICMDRKTKWLLLCCEYTFFPILWSVYKLQMRPIFKQPAAGGWNKVKKKKEFAWWWWAQQLWLTPWWKPVGFLFCLVLFEVQVIFFVAHFLPTSPKRKQPCTALCPTWNQVQSSTHH